MKIWTRGLSVMLILAAVSAVHAQQQGGPPGGGDPNGGGPGGPPGGGPGGDGGPPDPAEMRAMMDKRIKSVMNVTDDAWATLQPLIDKVQQLEHETDTGPLMHGRPHRHDDDDANGPGGDDAHPQSATESAIEDLKKVLTDKSSSDDKIATAMKTVEDAEKKAKDNLADARKELKAAVNTRQKAVLVAMGVLD